MFTQRFNWLTHQLENSKLVPTLMPRLWTCGNSEAKFSLLPFDLKFNCFDDYLNVSYNIKKISIVVISAIPIKKNVLGWRKRKNSRHQQVAKHFPCNCREYIRNANIVDLRATVRQSDKCSSNVYVCLNEVEIEINWNYLLRSIIMIRFFHSTALWYFPTQRSSWCGMESWIQFQNNMQKIPMFHVYFLFSKNKDTLHLSSFNCDEMDSKI